MKNKKIVIVGGAAGALIAEEIFAAQYKEVLFLEPYVDVEIKKVIGKKILEGIEYLKNKNVDYFIATGDNEVRKKNFDLIFKKTSKVPVNCIHETAYISKSCKIGNGNLICPFAVIHTEASIGDNTIINTGAIIEHSCLVEDYAQISPNATLCGYVSVGNSSFVGAGSTIIPKIKIGKNSVIAAGSSVIKDVGDNMLVAGVPAVKKKKL